jgi:hypothetical protein
MLVIDDILLFPFRGLMFVFRGIQNAAQEEVAGDAEAIRTELRELYMMLETGKMAEEEFDAREKELLDRLEEMERPVQNTQSNSTMAGK